MSLKFESRSVNEAFARQAVGAFAAQLDPTMEELGDIKTVVSEAVTNAIVHGYADRSGFITVTVRLFEGRILEVKVKDAGRGIENVEQARQPMFTTGDDKMCIRDSLRERAVRCKPFGGQGEGRFGAGWPNER